MLISHHHLDISCLGHGEQQWLRRSPTAFHSKLYLHHLHSHFSWWHSTFTDVNLRSTCWSFAEEMVDSGRSKRDRRFLSNQRSDIKHPLRRQYMRPWGFQGKGCQTIAQWKDLCQFQTIGSDVLSINKVHVTKWIHCFYWGLSLLKPFISCLGRPVWIS
jgi:hypothetical protein